MITALDHVNLRTADLAAMSLWYREVLGLEPGPRPAFSFPGAWLYAGGHAVVHLIGVDAAPGANPKDLRLEHFALRATGRAKFLAKLERLGIDHRSREIADFGIVQINLWDPDGNHIHVDFAIDEPE